MISETVATRYVKALLSVAAESGTAEGLAAPLRTLQALFLGHEELRAVLSNPRLPDERKRAVLLRVLGEDVPALLERFLDLLLRKRRLDVLAHAGSLYRELLDEAAGLQHAEVVTAFPLAPEDQERLAAALSARLQAQVLVEARVDPELIGGLAVKVGDVLVDGTISRRLREMRRRLSGQRR